MRVVIGMAGLSALAGLAFGWRAVLAMSLALLALSCFRLVYAIETARIDVLGLAYPSDEARVRNWAASAGVATVMVTLSWLQLL